MNTTRPWIAGACLALLVAACAPGGGSPQGTGGTGDVGAAGTGVTAGTNGNPIGAAGTAAGGTIGTGEGGGAGTGTSTGGSSGGTTSSSGTAGTTSSAGTAGTTATGGTGVGTGGTTATGGTQATAGRGGTGAGGTGAGGTGGSVAASNVLITSANGAFWRTGTWTETTANATVTVNDANAYQTWEGFGGAFNELGWSYLTTKAMQDQAIQLLFGEDGCRFTWGRIPMGASDYATNRYTLNESAGDTAMANFSIERDKQRLIPFIKAAQAVRPGLRFWASPWTPPTWMKSSPYQTPGNPVNAFDGGSMKSDEPTLRAHAQYFVKFIAAYAAENIKIDVVAPQNEPNYSQNYPSCIWSPTTFTTFIKTYLGPALAAANPTAQIMLGTMSNPGGNADVAVANAVLADATAKGYCKYMGVQWGMSDASQVNNLKSRGAGIPIWLSEHRCGGQPGANVATAPNDFNYGRESWGWIRDAIRNGLTMYNTWNMVLDPGGKGIDNTRVWAQNALLIANGGQLTLTPAYYVFRHVAQHVVPGARRVDATGGDAIAFKNPDGSLVAVMFNSGGANNSYVVAIGGKRLQFAMPGPGWATVKFRP